MRATIGLFLGFHLGVHNRVIVGNIYRNLPTPSRNTTELVRTFKSLYGIGKPMSLKNSSRKAGILH